MVNAFRAESPLFGRLAFQRGIGVLVGVRVRRGVGLLVPDANAVLVALAVGLAPTVAVPVGTTSPTLGTPVATGAVRVGVRLTGVRVPGVVLADCVGAGVGGS